MNSELKNIVLSSSIKNEKERLKIYRNEIFTNERKMSKLTFDRNVGLYAFTLEKYLRILSEGIFGNEDEVDVLVNTLASLESLQGVQEYIELRSKNNMLRNRIYDYFRSVNVDFRDEISSIEVPNIYVYNKDKFVHIIQKNNIKDNNEEADITIYPFYNITSNRELRHFYNKLSFHYLESLIDDCDFDISRKKLGKIKII